LHFDFGSVVADDRYPEEDEIRQIGDLESRYQSDARQHYTFDLLKPGQYQKWIADFKKGNLL